MTIVRQSGDRATSVLAGNRSGLQSLISSLPLGLDRTTSLAERSHRILGSVFVWDSGGTG